VGVGGKIRTGPDGQVDLPATFGAMGLAGEPWDSITVLAPEVADIVKAAGDIQKAMKSLKGLTVASASVKARLDALVAFAQSAPKLG
jgi:hypothetical protein